MTKLTLPERILNGEYTLNELEREIKGEIHVSLPCIVTKFDPIKQTVNCKPTIRELINIEGSLKFVELPELMEVPIETPRAGNFVITLPITIGQECRVTFQDLCIDGWWVRGGIQNWNDLRRHDLSDAIATFSPWSQPNSIPNYSTDKLEIRSTKKDLKISLSDDNITINSGDSTYIMVDEEKIHLQMGASSIIISNESIEVTGVLIINGVPYLSHKHSGVSSGNSNTGPISE